MTGEEWIVVAVGIGVALGQLIRLPARGPGDLVDAAERLVKSKKKMLVRPNGQISGVVLRDESYHDSRYQNLKRRRMVVLGLDGKTHDEPMDRINPETSQLEEVVVIDHAGGIALTQLKNPGGISTIMTGARAAAIKKDADDFLVVEQRVNKMEEEQEPLKRKSRDLQSKVAALKGQRDEALDKNKLWGEDFQTLINQNESLSARAAAAEAERDMLFEQIEGVKERYEELNEDMLESLKSKQKRERLKIQLGITGENDEEPPEEEEKKTESAKKPKKEEPSEEPEQ